MTCSHCGSSCGPVSSTDLTTAAVKQAFASIARDFGSNTIELVAITGGEPLLRSDLLAVIEHIRDLGFAHISLQTNGNALARDLGLATRLYDVGTTGLGLNLDGLRETHDQLRNQPGHFDQTVTFLPQITRTKSLYVTVTTLVSKANLHELHDIHALLSGLEINRWRLIEIQPMGRALFRPDLLLSKEELGHLIKFVVDHNIALTSTREVTGLPVELGCNGWLGRSIEGIARPYIWHCHAGISTLGIWSDGSIGGCTDIDHRRAQGHIEEDSIREVWENRFSTYRDWMNRKNGMCGSCKEWDLCHGGALHLRNAANELLHCPYAAVPESLKQNG